MKTKILTLLLLFAGSLLFAQRQQLGSLDSIKKLNSYKKELLGSWVLDTLNSNTVTKPNTIAKTKSLNVEHSVTQWTFLANKSLASAPYDKEILFWCTNATNDSIFLWAPVSDVKVALLAKLQLKELTTKKLNLFFAAGNTSNNLFFTRKEK
jgi:hypothetical protein